MAIFAAILRMNHRNKGKAKIILGWSCLLSFILLTYHFEGFAKNHNSFAFFHAVRDTPPPVIGNPIRNPKPAAPRTPGITEVKKISETTRVQVADTFGFKMSKDSLNSPVVYHADDSMVIDVPGKKMILYGKVSSVHYEDNNLSAPQIEYDQRLNVVSAFLKKDSLGRVLAYPYFTQNDLQTVSDTLRFNLSTKKGITKGTYTKQGEIFFYGEVMKKADSNTLYGFNNRFTTCNLDTPHFAFIAKRAKIVNKKWAYTGPVHVEFEGVPIPIPLPFGIFPLSQGRHSGLLAPSFNANDQLGISLENIGYYKILSPTWDVITKGTLYSYGSYAVNTNPRYYKRYHYRGDLRLAYQNIHQLDQAATKTFNIDWTHSADTKARPGVSFAANVHAGSVKYNQQVPNNPALNFTNQLQSSISYSKVWKNKPYSININANHSQNSVSGLTNLNLPDVSFNINTQYPFRRKEPVGDYKWYENIGIAYNGTAKSLTSFIDTLGHIASQINHNFQYGAQHSIPISLSLPALGALQLSPGITYEEKWAQRKQVLGYNPAKGRVDTISESKGLYTTRQMSFSLSASTRIFGMFGFGPHSRIKAIRHEIRPQVSFNYTPNFNRKNYYSETLDAIGTTIPVSYYQTGIYGTYLNQRFGGISFNIDNNVSMKLRNKKDTAGAADRKVSILDGLSISGGYNFLADSLKLQQFLLTARTNLFEKISLTASAQFDPYQVNEKGVTINKLVWANQPFSLGRLVSTSVSLTSSFKGGDKSKKSAVPAPDASTLANGVTMDEYQQEAAYIQNNPAEFVDFSIPWNVDLSYSFIMSKTFDLTKAKFTSTLTQGVTFNASANLTEKWKVGVNGSFDITTGQLGVLSGYLSRDLHCWQLGINVSPVGRYRFFSINISPKSAILRDLKVNRTRSFTDF